MSTVKLPGKLCSKFAPRIIGKITEEGYEVYYRRDLLVNSVKQRKLDQYLAKHFAEKR